MTKFGFVFLVLLGGAALWGLAQRRGVAALSHDPEVSRNERLTAAAGGVIFLLLAAIAVTVFDISGLLSVHYLVGFIMMPPILLKLGATGYRFVRYYTGSQAYRLAGAPPLLLRFFVAPVLVGATIVVFATGIELWLFGLRFGSVWILVHTIGAVVMVVAAAAHLLAHAGRTADLIREGGAAPGRTALSLRSLVVGSLAFGVVLAIASVLYVSPFTLSVGG